MPPHKRARDIEAAISVMPSTHVHCRDYGHAWAPLTASAFSDGKGYEQVLRCGRCDTRRKRQLNRYGEVITGGYDYSEGYLVAGLGRLTGSDRGLLRVASILSDLQAVGA
jgi:hypothetical protein